MAQTRYITVAEWVEGTDTRVLAQLSSDTDAPITVDETNARLLNAIERGSSDVQSSALRGGRYSSDDLDALKTADDWTMKGLVADLATRYLYESRGGSAPEDVQRRFRDADAALEDLRQGRQVFNDSDAIGAGVPEVAIMNAGQRARLHMVSDTEYFPRERIPPAV